MATIKSYTDLSQSKTLSKILSLESADMYWSFGNIKLMDDDYDSNIVQDIPCWSLAALLNVLPKIDNYRLRLEIKHTDNSYCCCYTEENHGGDLYWHYADNPVDACVAMIEKLHELKML